MQVENLCLHFGLLNAIILIKQISQTGVMQLLLIVNCIYRLKRKQVKLLEDINIK